jgi:glycosyltransferase involved in cell wall biosynthesis
MKVSIITVCLNSEKTIEQTILSVINQSYDDVEYIIVDGNSSDNTLEIVNKYTDHINCIISEIDDGLYDAMNKGIKLSTGNIIGILNSDDLFENNYVISDVVNKFNSNSSASFVTGDVVYVRRNCTKDITRYYSSEMFKSYKLRFGWMPPHAATFIKSDVYKDIGLYSNEYQISADYEFFVRMLYVHKLKFSRLNNVLVRMRNGGISTSGMKSLLKLNMEIVTACKKNGMYTNFFILLFKFPLKFLEYFKRPY